MKTKKTAFLGMLCAVALLAAYTERMLPSPVPSVPGIKLGVANAVILSILYLFDGKTAFTVNLTRILFAGLLFSGISGASYALAGGLCSFSAMLLGKKIKALSVIGVSVLGGCFHNVGQILLAIVLLQTPALIHYLPILILSGVLTGVLVGYISKSCIKHLTPYCNKFISYS